MNEQENVNVVNEQVTTPVAEPTTDATPEVVPAAPAVETLEPVVETLDGVTVESSQPEPKTTPAPAPVTTEQSTGSVILTGVPSSEAPAASATEAPAPAPVSAPEIIPAAAPATEAPAPAPTPAPTAEPPKEENKKEAKEKGKKEKKEKEPKEKKPFNPLLIILLVVGLVIGVGAGILISGSMKKEDSGNTSTSDDVTSVVTPSTYKVLFRDYLFDVPTDYDVQVNNNRLLIIGQGITYAVEIRDNSYEVISNNKVNIREGYENKNYVVNNMEEKYLGSGNYLVFDLNNGNNLRVFIRQNNPTSVFVGVIKKSDSAAAIEDSDLTVVDQILASASLSNHRSNSEETGETDTSFDDLFVTFNGVQLDESAVPDTAQTPTEENTPEQKPDETPATPTEEKTPEQKPEETTTTPTEQNAPSSGEETVENNTTTTPQTPTEDNSNQSGSETPTENSGSELPATTGE